MTHLHHTSNRALPGNGRKRGIAREEEDASSKEDSSHTLGAGRRSPRAGSGRSVTLIWPCLFLSRFFWHPGPKATWWGGGRVQAQGETPATVGRTAAPVARIKVNKERIPTCPHPQVIGSQGTTVSLSSGPSSLQLPPGPPRPAKLLPLSPLLSLFPLPQLPPPLTLSPLPRTSFPL